MPRFKPSDYEQDLLLSVALGKQIVKGSLDWAIHELIEHRIDLTNLDKRYNNDRTGAPAYNPRVMLKIVLAGYSRGILSSRRLEQTCKENVVFMALTCGATPDHSTIAGFVTNLDEQAMHIFQEILMVCEQEDLLEGTHLSIDGTKMPSNAAKEWSGTFQQLKDKKKKIQQKICEMVETHQRNDQGDPGDDEKRDRKRLKKLHDAHDKIDEFLKGNEPKKGFTGKEVQSNITDPESAKMSTSHGVLQGYNANAVVDGKKQIIVGAYAFGWGTDHRNLPVLLQQTQENLQHIGLRPDLKGVIMSADTSYFSMYNLAICHEYEVDAYIPDPKFRSRDPRLAERNKHRKKTLIKDPNKNTKRCFTNHDFHYNANKTALICPEGKTLMPNGKNSIRKGKRYDDFRARSEDCETCNQSHRCLRKGKLLARSVSKPIGEAKDAKKTIVQRMKEKIDTEHGRKTYSKRMGMVEPVFATINFHKGMKRFMLRGIQKVNLQWMLYCTVHNITKINNRKWALAG